MAFPTPKRITELDLASPLTDADQIAIVQGTRTKRATISQVKTASDTSCQCTLVSRYNTVGTDANTLEKFFQTYQMPADTLSTDGSWLEVLAWGRTANNNNTKTIEFNFGAATSTFQFSGGNASNVRWEVSCKIIRQTQNTQILFNRILGYSTTISAPSEIADWTSATEDTGNDIAISISGTNGTASASDITCEGLIIRVNHMDANS